MEPTKTITSFTECVIEFKIGDPQGQKLDKQTTKQVLENALAILNLGLVTHTILSYSVNKPKTTSEEVTIKVMTGDKISNANLKRLLLAVTTAVFSVFVALGVALSKAARTKFMDIVHGGSDRQTHTVTVTEYQDYQGNRYMKPAQAV